MKTYLVHLALSKFDEIRVDANTPAEAAALAAQQRPDYRATDVDEIEPDGDDYSVIESRSVMGICEVCETAIFHDEKYYSAEDESGLICSHCAN